MTLYCRPPHTSIMESKVIIPPTLPTFGHPTVYFYPTVSPRVVVVPILSCIIGFPVLVMLVICGLRYRAKRARTSAKKAHNVESSIMELSSGPSILASRCSNGKTHRQKRKKALVRFKPMPEIDLDTVVEEKSEFDAEVTASDLLTTPEELIIPEEPTPPASFRAYRYMGAVQATMTSPIKTSPYRNPHTATNLDNVTEEMEVVEDVTLDVSDDEGLDAYDDDDVTNGNAVEREGISDDNDEGGEQPGSGGSSDSDTVGACFSLSPKQVTKSPTGVHLALKKLDGAVKRRHSSPVKVNYGKNKGQRGSGKVNHSYTSEEESPQPARAGFDYIDRELMPDISPRTRSHSVKHPSRRAASFTIKKRHGESLKLRSKSFSRSISHVHDGHDGRPRVHQRNAYGGDSASTSQIQNGVLECDVHVVGENGAQKSSSGDQIYSDEISTKTVSDAETLSSGNETDWSGASRKPRVSVRRSYSLVVRVKRDDSESPMRRRPQRSRTACGESEARELCQVPPIISEESLLQCRQPDLVVSPPASADLSVVNELSLKHRQEDGEAARHCHRCREEVDRDDERSTLV
ncbi:uncharacterized protein LOC121864550 [Homarus americanus]|uniref:uncharacterized protein LOC121864550 n=1 Tax=Homarus americanus TaxID=6706 RepID=UPI001C48B169|nr:uncharacterized protein LOC121864550 [Homarus americanus]XP_042219563.1 uncharacterized protein LOC121864550 [Homarus americanus]XP_042219569.1 uncharacterized protein LOC121864550 [Homarus americanus]XP_042219574.1 uncharacterized protein LOC121864550 [Homarus americanus]XP_042219581.1 uncharacterized protein LOC121864550 [Homarus americanus]